MGMSRYALTALSLSLVLTFSGYKLWSWGDTHGRNKIQSQWNQEKAIRAKAVQMQIDLNAALVKANRETTERLTHALAEQNTQHQVELANAQSDFDKRLLKSQQRADTYKRMSETGIGQCRDLASHAAKLDRTLEEGRSVVRELRETLRFRDEQLTLVSAKLLADRKLLTSDDADGR